MPLIELEEIDLEVTDEQRASYSDISKDHLIEVHEVLGRINDSNIKAFEDLALVLGLHDPDLNIREGPSIHVVCRAIALIGQLSQIPRDAEMDAFYERGGSLPGE